MGDILFNSKNESFVRRNHSVLGLDEYGSDEELSAVKLFKEYPEELLKFASLCCGLFMLIGIPGNLITITALARCKKVRNATAIFIINLSCSDLLFCAFNLPLAASTFWNSSWNHGILLCKMFPMARYALVAVSLFTVLAITINRYIMISWPRLYPKLYTRTYMAIMIVILWIFSFGALIATWLEKWGRFSLDPEVGSCSIVTDINNRSPKKVLFIGAFLIPGLAIIFCYARIFWIVKKVGKRSRPTPHPARPKTEISYRDSKDITTHPITINHINHISHAPKCTMANFNCLALPEMSSVSGLDTITDEKDKKISEGDKFFSRSSEALQKLRIALTPAPKANTPKSPKLLPSKKDRKLRTMIMAIMISFCFCHLPISVTKIFLEFTINPYVNILSYILLYLTTCINPIIYVVMSNEYRQAYKNLLMCRRSEQDFQDSSVLRRIAIPSVRQSVRKLNAVNTHSPT